MANTFEINGKTVIAKPFDYGMVCELEELGAPVDLIHEKPNNVLRAYVSVCLGVSKDAAAKEINDHVVNGGNFKQIVVSMNKELEDSGFFLGLNKEEEKKTQQNQK